MRCRSGPMRAATAVMQARRRESALTARGLPGASCAKARSRVAPPGSHITRAGMPSDAMFFIAAGEVEVMVQPAPIILQEGDFFGEVGLLQHSLRTATVRALTQVRLLVLEVDDFHRLMTEDESLRRAVESAERVRLRRPVQIAQRPRMAIEMMLRPLVVLQHKHLARHPCVRRQGWCRVVNLCAPRVSMCVV